MFRYQKSDTQWPLWPPEEKLGSHGVPVDFDVLSLLRLQHLCAADLQGMEALSSAGTSGHVLWNAEQTTKSAKNIRTKKNELIQVTLQTVRSKIQKKHCETLWWNSNRKVASEFGEPALECSALGGKPLGPVQQHLSCTIWIWLATETALWHIPEVSVNSNLQTADRLCISMMQQFCFSIIPFLSRHFSLCFNWLEQGRAQHRYHSLYSFWQALKQDKAGTSRDIHFRDSAKGLRLGETPCQCRAYRSCRSRRAQPWHSPLSAKCYPLSWL